MLIQFEVQMQLGIVISTGIFCCRSQELINGLVSYTATQKQKKFVYGRSMVQKHLKYCLLLTVLLLFG
jgi:hypothetical protein